ncbi:hypothetical protein BDZ94DRAFT_1257349 [Collybia nuda]|uniref:Uncharacterized protein n=1 Tax=Collybia nuda TaxID=64659 RepID=A0A9P5Y799_9AGAR|nr:hypothetical protein BDZ94DRAFT_1257349 [Collybia nuda]
MDATSVSPLSRRVLLHPMRAGGWCHGIFRHVGIDRAGDEQAFPTPGPSLCATHITTTLVIITLCLCIRF